MNPIKMRICNECNRCSFHRPQPLAWGHECWGYTEDGHRIIECESHIEDIPMIDSFTIDGEQTSTPATSPDNPVCLFCGAVWSLRGTEIRVQLKSNHDLTFGTGE